MIWGMDPTWFVQNSLQNYLLGRVRVKQRRGVIGFLFGKKPAAVWRERELPQMGRWWYKRQGTLGPHLGPMCVLDTFG